MNSTNQNTKLGRDLFVYPLSLYTLAGFSSAVTTFKNAFPTAVIQDIDHLYFYLY